MAVRSAHDRRGRPRCGGGAWRRWLSLKSADFAATLAAERIAKSPHFVLHHLAAHPRPAIQSAEKPLVPELSTGLAHSSDPSVDNKSVPGQWRLGLVVPKRHARRAVTRSLIKRQMRLQANQHRHALPPGQWAIRLRAPFMADQYPSAASSPLREAVRNELEQLFAAALQAVTA